MYKRQLKTRGRNTRVGLTATKKIGHAVQRNRARRVLCVWAAEMCIRDRVEITKLGLSNGLPCA